MHEYELSINLDKKTYTYKYDSPIALGKGVVIDNIGNKDHTSPVFEVESVTVDLTGSLEVMVVFSKKFDKEEIKKWHSFVENNWKCL